MTDWCPENDGAYRAEMAAMYPVQNRKRIEELEAKLDDKEAECRHLRGQVGLLKAKLATCEKYRDVYAECDRIGAQAVRDLEAKLAKAIAHLERVTEAVEGLVGPDWESMWFQKEPKYNKDKYK